MENDDASTSINVPAPFAGGGSGVPSGGVSMYDFVDDKIVVQLNKNQRKAIEKFNLPAGQELVRDFHCAYHTKRGAIHHGRLALFPNYFCFSSLTKRSIVKINVHDVTEVRPIPVNALYIYTRDPESPHETTRYYLGEWTKRAKAVRVMNLIWEHSKGIFNHTMDEIRRIAWDEHTDAGAGSNAAASGAGGSGSQKGGATTSRGRQRATSQLSVGASSATPKDKDKDKDKERVKDKVKDKEKEKEKEKENTGKLAEQLEGSGSLGDGTIALPPQLGAGVAPPDAHLIPDNVRKNPPGASEAFASMPIGRFFELFLASASKHYHDTHVVKLDEDVEVPDWEAHGDRFERVLSYKTPVQSKLVKATHCEVSETQVLYCLAKKRLYMMTNAKMAKIPYAEDFTVRADWEIVEDKNGATTASVWVWMNWINKPSFVAGMIEKGSVGGSLGFQNEWLARAKVLAAGGAAPPAAASPAATASPASAAGPAAAAPFVLPLYALVAILLVMIVPLLFISFALLWQSRNLEGKLELLLQQQLLQQRQK